MAVPGNTGQGQLQASGPFHQERMHPFPGSPAVDVSLWRRLSRSPPLAGQLAELGLDFPAAIADAGRQEGAGVWAWPRQHLPPTLSRATSVCWISPQKWLSQPQTELHLWSAWHLPCHRSRLGATFWAAVVLTLPNAPVHDLLLGQVFASLDRCSSFF